MRKFSVFLAIMLLTTLQSIGKPHIWQKWVKTFTIEADIKNPYTDLTLRATFTGPDAVKFTTFGYWTGDQQYEIAFSFPKTGKWSWFVEAVDLKGENVFSQKGNVDVTDYEGNNLLYTNGFLKVGDSKRYLTYHNNKPFLWMGCTAWIGPANSTFDEWKQYVDDRSQKQFTMIQVTPFQKWNKTGDTEVAEKNEAGEYPFHDYFARINPSFWLDLAKKVEYANQQGLVVTLVGLPGWQFYFDNESEQKIFVRYLTGLFAGSFVIFAPASDTKFSLASDELAMQIDSMDQRHLITQHPGTPSGKRTNIYLDDYYDKDYLDFSMCQTGHNTGRSKLCVWNSIHWNYALYQREPHKPVINAESFYHGNPNANDWRVRGTDKDARSTGWYSWLSGSLGYTYGALGIWNWGKTTGGVHVPWKDALQLNSSFQMAYMSGFFSSINWWELEPEPQGILMQPKDTLLQSAFSRNKLGTLGVAYIPSKGKAIIDLKDFSAQIDMQWFNPRKNSYMQVQRLTKLKEPIEFIPPGSDDWVLLLKGL